LRCAGCSESAWSECARSGTQWSAITTIAETGHSAARAAQASTSIAKPRHATAIAAVTKARHAAAWTTLATTSITKPGHATSVAAISEAKHSTAIAAVAEAGHSAASITKARHPTAIAAVAEAGHPISTVTHRQHSRSAASSTVELASSVTFALPAEHCVFVVSQEAIVIQIHWEEVRNAIAAGLPFVKADLSVHIVIERRIREIARQVAGTNQRWSLSLVLLRKSAVATAAAVLPARSCRHESFEFAEVDPAVVILVILLALGLQRLGNTIDAEFREIEYAVFVDIELLEILFDSAIAIATESAARRHLHTSTVTHPKFHSTAATGRHSERHAAALCRLSDSLFDSLAALLELFASPFTPGQPELGAEHLDSHLQLLRQIFLTERPTVSAVLVKQLVGVHHHARTTR
jgi:hypothetical protein